MAHRHDRHTYFPFLNTIIYSGSLRPTRRITRFRCARGVGETVTKMSITRHGVCDRARSSEIESAFDQIVGLVRDEDYDVTGESWSNFLHMPTGSTVVYGRQELAVQSLHRWVAETIGCKPPLSSA
jgi:hypothetical protein